jgi:Methyltransferase domain
MLGRLKRYGHLSLASLAWAASAWRGYSFAKRWKSAGLGDVYSSNNPLRQYFDETVEGPGIFKWNHYFDIYHRHFAKFRGKDVRVLEIGVYSGGSLGMWRHYFGPKSHIYGVDIEPACGVYAADGISILIGDQADRGFWRKVRTELPPFDVIIDDGGHDPEQQIVTLEETLPHLRPGGVYLCEDIHHAGNRFLFYVDGVVHNLSSGVMVHEVNPERWLAIKANGLQSRIESIHHYPLVVVIETRADPVNEFISPKRGTQWQPESFLTGKSPP